MKNYIKFLFLLISFYTYSQERKVAITSQQKGNKVYFFAHNKDKVTQQITLFLDTKGFQKHKNEITKLVKPQDSILMITLSMIPNKKHNLSNRYEYVPKPTQKEKEAKKKELQEKVFGQKGDDINKGIVVFGKDNCPRCHRTTSYLLDKNIDFKWLQIPSNHQAKAIPTIQKQNGELLNQMLQENDFTGSFTLPVVMVDGKLSHSHQDLEKFLKTLQ